MLFKLNLSSRRIVDIPGILAVILRKCLHGPHQTALSDALAKFACSSEILDPETDAEERL